MKLGIAMVAHLTQDQKIACWIYVGFKPRFKHDPNYSVKKIRNLEVLNC